MTDTEDFLDIYDTDSEAVNTYLSVCEAGSADDLREIFSPLEPQECKELIAARFFRGFFLVCSQGDTEKMAIIIDAAEKISPDFVKSFLNKRPWLNIAVSKRHHDATQLLMDIANRHGFLKELCLGKKSFAFAIACAENNPEYVRWFIETAGEHNFLQELLLNNRANALSASARMGNIDIARQLLECAQAEGCLGEILVTGCGNAYRDALTEGNDDIVELLLDSAATVTEEEPGYSCKTKMCLGAYSYMARSPDGAHLGKVIGALEDETGELLTQDTIQAMVLDWLFQSFGKSALIDRQAVREACMGRYVPPLDIEIKDYQTLGLEVECTGLNAAQEDSTATALKLFFDWNVEHDKSIRAEPAGAMQSEMVSPVIDPKNVASATAAVRLLDLVGAEANDSCALHVHHGVQRNIADDHERIETIKQLTINYLIIEKQLDSVLGPKGSMDDYYRIYDKMPDVDFDSVVRNILESDNVVQIIKAMRPDSLKDDGNSRLKQRTRSKINLYPAESLGLSFLPPLGTIEFRHHPGTTEPEIIIPWVQFVADFFDNAHEMVMSGQESGRIQAHMPDTIEIEHLRERVELLATQRSELHVQRNQGDIAI